MEVRTAYSYAADLRRVVDADTLDFVVDLGWRISTHQRIRLLGVQAPERHTLDGKAATAWVTDWLHLHAPTGRVLLHTRKPTDHDSFGRYLAYLITADGHCLNRDLLNAGIATPYPT